MARPVSRFAFVPRLAFVLVLVAGAVAVWYFAVRERPRVPPPDEEGAYAANMRGIGHMEQFHYDLAAEAFREAVEKYPEWTVARVNLAIALLNFSQGQSEDVASILKGVLRHDPFNPHAHYTLGVYLKHRGKWEEAYPHFDAVTRIDPNDAFSWLNKAVCHPKGEESPEAIRCLHNALRLDPYLNAARHKLFGLARGEERVRLRAEVEQLQQAFWERPVSDKYTDQGPYAEVIGRTAVTHPPQPVGPLRGFDPWEQFTVRLAPGARWATADDFRSGPAGDLMREVRQRFGATMVVFDFDRDGKPDLFLLSAVVEGGRVRDLLLHNDGGGRFTDVTAQAGLRGMSGSLGCAVADFDNDDFRDLLITGTDGVRLFRNTGQSRFDDVTKQAGMDQVGGVCFATAWVDLDQDCDLDAVICRLAEDVPGALDVLRGRPAAGSRVEVFANRGDAAPVPEGQRQPPLTVAFLRADRPKVLLPQQAITGLVLSDLDADKDVDLLYLGDGKVPQVVRNDRLLRFEQLAGFPAAANAWNGGAVLDMNNDGRSDLLLLPHEKPPLLLISRPGAPDRDVASWFYPGATNSYPLRQALCVDLDSDGWTDVVGVTTYGALIFLQNDGQNRLARRTGALGLNLPGDLIAVNVADLDSDCHPDLIAWSDGKGLMVHRGLDNGNKSLQLELTGRYESDRSRTNADGIGCRAMAFAGKLAVGLENTTIHAGLGQSRQPLSLGIGGAASADVLRILWPDGVLQAELSLASCKINTIKEINRKPTSCPILSVWDGERFRYVTDFLGGGASGESGPDGSVRPPRPEESVKIEPGLMRPKDGKLLLKIAEPMDEVIYLDRVELLAIDHPKETQVHPDERFVLEGPMPSQELLVFDKMIGPVRATDHRGRDVSGILKDRDGKMVSGFARRAWIGYAEEHSVELDFGDRLSKLKAGERVFLVMAGWTDYPFAESMYAATQAGVPTITPTLERLRPDGQWKDLGDIGFPAGLPRVMTKEVTGLVEGPDCRLRIRTNLQIHWDQIMLAPLSGIAKPGDHGRVGVAVVPLGQATLAARGFIKEIRPHGPTGPVEYDDSQTERVEVTPWQGMLTRLGDVTDLVRRDDDQFVVMGPGDEVTVSFDANALPPLPAGHVRSYVLRTWGYSKDTAPTTVTGGLVEPLPFRGFKNFPFVTPEEQRMAEAAQVEYRQKWNTRPAAGGPG
jgi:Tfp pilus assembly protein PilF